MTTAVTAKRYRVEPRSASEDRTRDNIQTIYFHQDASCLRIKSAKDGNTKQQGPRKIEGLHQPFHTRQIKPQILFEHVGAICKVRGSRQVTRSKLFHGMTLEQRDYS
jgi:hypothetical protein